MKQPLAKAFLTGSRIYGKPRKDSDIDLVVLMDETTMQILARHADAEEVRREAYEEEQSVSLRFGKLNILAVATEYAYQTWLRGTKELVKNKPVNRDFACSVMQMVRGGMDAARAVQAVAGPRRCSHSPRHDEDIPF